MFLVHANRLKFYADSQLNVTQELLETINHNDPHYNVVIAFLDLRYNRSTRRYELKAKWRGFADERPTWEPHSIMIEDVPDMFQTFLDSFPNKDVVQRARDSLSRSREGEV